MIAQGLATSDMQGGYAEVIADDTVEKITILKAIT